MRLLALIGAEDEQRTLLIFASVLTLIAIWDLPETVG
jgi:hypothetical protein